METSGLPRTLYNMSVIDIVKTIKKVQVADIRTELMKCF